MIPQNSIISEEQVISRIKFDLRLTDTTEHDTHLEILLREGLGSLNCISQLEKKNCVLKADDNRMKMPDDLIQFVALKPKLWVQSDLNPIYSNLPVDCQRFIYADTAFLNSCGCGNSEFLNYTKGFQISKGYIHFNSHVQLDQAMISYLGIWKDENGKPAIFERFERALNAYSCWKFTRSWPEKYNQYTMESYRSEWVNQKDFLRGQDVQRDFQNNKFAISELVRAFIVSPIVLVP